MLTDLQCDRGAKLNTSMLSSPWTPPSTLWGSVGKKSKGTLPLAQDVHQCPFRGLRNDDSAGQSATIPAQPSLLFSVFAGTELVCLASIWPPVTESRLIWCLLPLHCPCWKANTPALLNDVDVVKCLSLGYSSVCS